MAGPACVADAVPVTTKIPVPIVQPMPIMIKSKAVSDFLKEFFCEEAIKASIDFLRKILIEGILKIKIFY
jgi:hypothetical protein